MAVLFTCLLMLASIVVAQNKGFDTSFMDTSVKACDNFFRYAVGGWLKKNEIPAAYSSWGVDQMVEKRNFEILREVLETSAKNTAVPKGSDTQLVGDFYAACMDEAEIDRRGAKPLDPYFKEIDRVKNQKELLALIAQLQRRGFPAVFTLFAGADEANSAINIANLYQGGLSLPSRDYYLSPEDKMKQTREKFVSHVTRMFELLGEKPADARSKAETVMKMETRLATASKSPVELRDPVNYYHKMKLADANAATPNLAWDGFARELGVPAFTEINVGQPDFFREVSRMLSETPLDEWKTYLRWHVLNRAAPRLAKPFDDENFSFFGTYLRGRKEQYPRWRRCLVATDRSIGEALGQEYLKRAFTPDAKKRMEEMVDNLFAAFHERLTKIDWMTGPTRQQALAKLAAFQRKIGYPEKLRGYKGLSIDRGSYFANYVDATTFETVRDLQDVGKPVDRTRWAMTPPTINAYYNPNQTEIVFPAGILQPPFFNMSADDAVNYGAIGAVIGHEITHGFDDQGSKYDAQGNLRQWWTPEDRKRFDERASCVSKQFSNYEVLPGLKMNGELTLGENIADLGGAIIAYEAFKKSMEGKPRPAKIDGFTPEQRFFLGYAVTWMVNQRPEDIRVQVLNDPHALPEWRTIGPFSNMPEFAAAFSCKPGDNMVNPKPCQVW